MGTVTPKKLLVAEAVKKYYSAKRIYLYEQASLESIAEELEKNFRDGQSFWNYGAGPGKWRIYGSPKNPNLLPTWHEEIVMKSKTPRHESI